jgi:Fe-S-cluster containining protein
MKTGSFDTRIWRRTEYSVITPLMETKVQFRLCAKCAELGKCCCKGTDIYITPGDLRRISLNHGNEVFYEFRGACDPAYLNNSDDPIWMTHVFRANGTRRLLKQDGAGNCYFLGPGGCRLEPEERPLICRLHPYEYDAVCIHPEAALGCPRHLLPEGVDFDQAVGLRMDLARQWHRSLYLEILEENLEDDNWHYL